MVIYLFDNKFYELIDFSRIFLVEDQIQILFRLLGMTEKHLLIFYSNILFTLFTIESEDSKDFSPFSWMMTIFFLVFEETVYILYFIIFVTTFV